MEVESIPDDEKKGYTVYAVGMWHDIHCLVCGDNFGKLNVYEVSDQHQSKLRYVLSESTKSGHSVWDRMSQKQKEHLGTYFFIVPLL